MLTHYVFSAIDWHVVGRRILHPDSTFLHALGTTVYIAVIAQVVGVALGVLGALMRRSRLWVLRAVVYVYVLVFRGTPIVVQIFFIYFGANLLVGFNLFPRSVSFGLFSVSGAVLAGTTALALNEGAYMTEIVRAGIDAVDIGQLEAARALGMHELLAMRRVILPQAARTIIPPLGNEFNSMLKNTSLLAFIGVYEIFQDADVHYSTTFQPVEYFGAVAFWYLILTSIWAFVQLAIEAHFSLEPAAKRHGRLARFLDAVAPVRARA